MQRLPLSALCSQVGLLALLSARQARYLLSLATLLCCQHLRPARCPQLLDLLELDRRRLGRVATSLTVTFGGREKLEGESNKWKHKTTTRSRPLLQVCGAVVVVGGVREAT